MNIAFCATRNLYKNLAITITSLIKHNNKHIKSIYLIIEDDEYSYFKDDRIKVYNINKLNLEFESTSPNTNKYYTYMSLIRIYLPIILHNEDKVISMDCDMVVNGDLFEVWNWDLGNNYVAAVPEYRKVQPAIYNNYQFNWPYVNVGFTIMNLKLMRETHIVDALISLVNSVDLKWADQDAINMLCKDHIMLLPYKYNTCPYTGMSEHPIIVHGTPNKPWDGRVDNYITPMWEYFKEIYNNEYSIATCGENTSNE